MAESVSIDFGDQQSEIKDETVSQDNNNKPALNPVKLYAHTVQLLYGYPGFLDKWSIYKFHNGKTFTNISSRKILQDLQASVQCIGPDILGFTSKDIRTHSDQASLAMMMYLVKEPVYTTMPIGCWSSNAFLAYIEKQIKKFTKGVSSSMLQTKLSTTPLSLKRNDPTAH